MLTSPTSRSGQFFPSMLDVTVTYIGPVHIMKPVTE
jgi:hypothetical protein